MNLQDIYNRVSMYCDKESSAPILYALKKNHIIDFGSNIPKYIHKDKKVHDACMPFDVFIINYHNTTVLVKIVKEREALELKYLQSGSDQRNQ